MREILFRGKAINRENGFFTTNYRNGDWVYGLITKLYDDRFKTLPAEMTNTDGVRGIDIDYKTVGQYTGLTDKNGKKIFEGDIVKDHESGLYGEVVFATAQDGFDGIGGFMVDDINDGLQNYNGFWHLVEVIGNIYDNPELLKEAQQE